MHDELQSESPTSCPECGGQRVDVPCGVQMNLQPSWTSYIRLQAVACTLCGYTALYAQDLQKLQRLLEKRGKNR